MFKMGSGIASLDVIGKISHGHGLGLGIASSDISGGNKNF